MPKPFSRPRIELGKPSRVWRRVEPHELRRGDVVADVGEVREAWGAGNVVLVQNVEGRQFSLPAGELVLAFVEA